MLCETKICDFDYHKHYVIFNFAIYVLDMQYCVVSDIEHSAVLIYGIFLKIAN